MKQLEQEQTLNTVVVVENKVDPFYYWMLSSLLFLNF